MSIFWFMAAVLNALSAGVSATTGGYGYAVFHGMLVIVCCAQGVIHAIRSK